MLTGKLLCSAVVNRLEKLGSGVEGFAIRITTIWYQFIIFFFFQAEDGIRDKLVTGVQTCALPICEGAVRTRGAHGGGGAERAARARPRAHPGVRPDPRGRAGAGARSPIRGAAGGDAARSPRPGAGRPGGGAAAGGKGAGAARRALRAQAFQPARSA